MQIKSFFLRRLSFTLLSALLVLILSGCAANEANKGQGANVDIKQASTEEATPQPTQEPKPSILKKGDKAKLGDFKIKLKSVKIKKSIPSGDYFVFKPDKGSKFIVIGLSVKNIGKKENTFLPTVSFSNNSISAKIIYDGEYEFNRTRLIGYSADLNNEKLNPLESKTGIVAFSVAKKALKTNKKPLVLQLALDDEVINYSLK